ncbi:MAG: TIGR04084 family radical SAM/SPASM domain-containing protein [Nanoarchaeota archaeon]|nr:TIGR04084 family radical SAM/SPASM domain-containing protein [Nanoarchaeota archaeon]
MYFHLINTINCNSECRYCYKKSMDDFGNDLNDRFKFEMVPEKASYSVDQLKKFLNRSKERHTLTFYGGEPLLNIEWMKRVMDNVDARFMIQTNGKLLDKLDSRYTNKFEVILVSIDGPKEITDANRGAGTYDKVLSNIQHIRKNGFKNELIARMVVDETSVNLVENIKHLLSIGFNSVHWQIDAGFYCSDYEKRDFKKFSEQYNQEIKKLADLWIENIKAGKVLKIYPFLGIFESLYYNKKENLRCGSGYANYTITTNGKISVCPIMYNASFFYLGDIIKNNPDELRQTYVDGFCENCDILDLCGGRCLYANKARLWPEEGQNLICGTVRNLIETIREKLPEIKELIANGIVREKDFFYEKYNGAEIIP